jgi:hypothetical protein
MSYLTDTYREVCKQRDAAYEGIIDACLHVVLLANILRTSPQNVQIVGIPNAIGISSAGVPFNGSQWPTASAINNALADYHAAIGAVRTAWLNVQIHGEQQGLAPPPDDPWATMRTELLNRASRPPQ